MAPGIATKIISASCALTAFSVGIMAGLFAGNPAETILARSLVALVVGYFVGMIVGAIGERTVVEGIKQYQLNRPIPGAKDGPSAQSLKLSA